VEKTKSGGAKPENLQTSGVQRRVKSGIIRRKSKQSPAPHCRTSTALNRCREAI
jgi:hypothetical protein